MTQLVFVDSRVPRQAELFAALDCQGQPISVSADDDGLRQMNQALAGVSGVDSIRLFAHGRPGAFLLGAMEVDAGTLSARADEFAAIGRALNAGGDCQLYGCAVGEGSTGCVFVEALADGLGAPVAASSTPIGHSERARRRLAARRRRAADEAVRRPAVARRAWDDGHRHPTPEYSGAHDLGVSQ
ncbi:MAG: DUF4347 domain-containing protein [Candidatus Accumulibacter sp.]|nr:DUF4347 domain-containing protein [Accumulibacter sp.]